MTQYALRWLSMIALVLACHFSSFSQNITNVNPTINLLDGGAFYIHEVLEGQEIEAIAAAYYAEIPEIIKANPEIRTGLKVGMKLKIPYSDESLEAMSKNKIESSILTEVQPKKIEQKSDRVPATPILPQKQSPKPVNQSPMQEAAALLDEVMEEKVEAPKPIEQTIEVAETPKPAPIPVEETVQPLQPKVEPLDEAIEMVEETVDEIPTETEEEVLMAEESVEIFVPEIEPEQPKQPAAPAPKVEIKKEEEPKVTTEPELTDLSQRIKESLNTLEQMKKALEVGPTEIPVVELADDADHYFAMDFLEDHLNERFDSDSSIQEFYIKEYFLARIDPNGVIVSVRDERTATNKNTQDLNVEDVADLTLYSYPNVQNKLGETALGLNADVKVYHYKLKVKKKNIKVYKETMYAEHLPKDHIHYEMIMAEAEKQGQFGKCEVILWDGFIYTARYKKVEYNPFGEMTDVIDERRIQRIVKMKF